MNIDTLRQYLDDSYAAGVWLCGLGIVDVRRAHGNLLGMAQAGVTLDLLAVLGEQLERHLPGCADPDMALLNLERFVRAARNPLAVGTLFERDPEALPTLLQIFSASHYLSDLLVMDPEGFDLLRLTEGQPVARQALVEELVAEIDAALEHEPGRACGRFGGSSGVKRCGSPYCRHRSRAKPAHGHLANLLRGRRDFGGRVAGGAAEVPGPAGHAAAVRRHADPLRHPGHGQARRPGAKLFERHRPDLPRRERGPHRRAAPPFPISNSSTSWPARLCDC